MHFRSILDWAAFHRNKKKDPKGNFSEGNVTHDSFLSFFMKPEKLIKKCKCQIRKEKLELNSLKKRYLSGVEDDFFSFSVILKYLKKISSTHEKDGWNTRTGCWKEEKFLALSKMCERKRNKSPLKKISSRKKSRFVVICNEI